MENKGLDVGDIAVASARLAFRDKLRNGFIFKVLNRTQRAGADNGYTEIARVIGIGEVDGVEYEWVLKPFDCWVGNLVKDQFMTDVYHANETRNTGG